MKEMNQDIAARFFLIMGGLNVLTPRCIRDTKIAELDWTEELEDRYIYMQKALSGLSQEQIEVIFKRAILDFVKPLANMNVTDFSQQLTLESAEWIKNHKEDKADIEDAKKDLSTFLGIDHCMLDKE